MTAAPEVTGEILLYKVPDAMRMLNLSKWALYDQIRRGRLRSVCQGRARLIPASALREYVELLLRESESAAS